MKIFRLLVFLLLVYSAQAQRNITAYEYWLDGDHPNKSSVNVTPTPEFILAEELDVTSATSGFHLFNIRFSDDDGNWSGVISQLFFKMGNSGGEEYEISEYEFWVDDYQNRKSGTLEPGGEVLLDDLIDVSELPNGFHTFYIRFKDAGNIWSSAIKSVFFKMGNTENEANLVTSYRYWFDNDYQNIVNVDLPEPVEQAEVNLLLEIPSENVDAFNIQFLDVANLWSSVYTRLFVPEANFEVFNVLNTFTFMNKTIFGASYEWNFGDGSPIDSSKNPSHHYKIPGVYNVTLTAFNKLGQDDTVHIIEVRGLRSVVSNSAGNTGDASILVYGGGFDKNAKVWLDGPEKIDADTSYIERLDAVFAKFDLRGKPVGVYDVYVQFPGDTVMSLKSSFTITQGTEPKPYVDIVGRNRILFKRWQSYQMNIGNTGNVDASGVTLFFIVSNADQLELEFVNLDIAMSPDTSMNSLRYLLDSIPLSYHLDTLNGKPFDGNLYIFYIPSIPANSSNSLELRVKTNQTFQMYAWMNEPYFQSPFDDAVAECISDVMKWYVAEKGLDIALKWIPGAGCLKNIGKEAYGTMSRVIERKIGKDENGERYKNWKDWAWGWGNWAVDLTAIGVKCAMDVFPPTQYVKAAVETAIELNKIKKDIIKLKGADEKCKKKFAHLSKKGQQIDAVSSFDPNEMVGPSGYTDKVYTKNDGRYNYVVYFENKSTATAPAQEVIVLDTLDKTKFDFSSFSFGSFGFSGKSYTPLTGLKQLTLNIDSILQADAIVRMNAKFDTATGIISWQFITLDRKTGDYPEDPDVGFLPPNKTSPQGEGFVSFNILLLQSLNNNDSIKNQANIYFDMNDPILTNNYLNSLDLQKPESQITGIYYTEEPNYYRMAIQGIDKESGISHYLIYASEDNGEYLPISSTNQTYLFFHAEAGKVYKFYSVAVDSVGNIEDPPLDYDVSTLNVSVNDNISVLPLDLKIFPNPASDDVNFAFCITDASMISLRIFNSYGTEIYSPADRQLFSAGTHFLSFNSQLLPAGIYIAQLQSAEKLINRRFVIVR